MQLANSFVPAFTAHVSPNRQAKGSLNTGWFGVAFDGRTSADLKRFPRFHIEVFTSEPCSTVSHLREASGDSSR